MWDANRYQQVDSFKILDGQSHQFCNHPMAPGSSNTKRKAAHLDASANHVGFSVPSVKRVHYTVTSEMGTKKLTAVIDRLTPVSTIPTAYNSASTSVQNPKDCALPEMKKKTQVGSL
jgi:hypothetical protein